MTEDQKIELIIDKLQRSFKSYSKNASELGINVDGQGLFNSWVIKKLAKQELEINELKDKLVNP